MGRGKFATRARFMGAHDKVVLLDYYEILACVYKYELEFYMLKRFYHDVFFSLLL